MIGDVNTSTFTLTSTITHVKTHTTLPLPQTQRPSTLHTHSNIQSYISSPSPPPFPFPSQVHNGNTRKLVTKGAIECVITALQKYPQDTAIQRAGAMAVASLARLEPNRYIHAQKKTCMPHLV